MSKTRNLSDLLDANGDVKSTALDNVPASDVVNDTTPQLGGTLDMNGFNINGGDDDQIQLGASNDLQIFHDGTHSQVRETGTGDLLLKGDANVKIQNSSGTEDKAIFTSDGAVQLYHNNAIKLTTSSSGIGVFGDVGASNFDLNDNAKLRVGTSDDLQIYHDGSNSYINEQGSGNLLIRASSAIRLQRHDGTENFLTANQDGACELYYNGTKRLETTNTGATVTGDLNVTGSISGAGKVGQVIQTVKGNVSSTTSSSYTQISGLTASITPSSSSSKVLVKIAMYIGRDTSSTVTFKAYRGGTIIGIGDADGARERVSARISPDNIHWMFPVYYEYLDSPSTTSATTYSMYWQGQSGLSVYINRTSSNGNDTTRDQARPISTITLMEILP